MSNYIAHVGIKILPHQYYCVEFITHNTCALSITYTGNNNIYLCYCASYSNVMC